MIMRASLLTGIPTGLRDPLLAEFDTILQSYLEARWSPTELSGGRFCEVVFTILQGYASGTYPTVPSKPRDMVSACRALEAQTHVPRSFQILIPRLLPALYEIRNNRGVGHVGGDVDPNLMDATVVVGIVKWIMGEFVRVFHAVSVTDAQATVDVLSETTLPVIWSSSGVKRCLDSSLPLKDQIVLLLASASPGVSYQDLERWLESGYLLRTLRKLHKDRYVEFDEVASMVVLLPPGVAYAGKRARELRP